MLPQTTGCVCVHKLRMYMCDLRMYFIHPGIQSYPVENIDQFKTTLHCLDKILMIIYKGMNFRLDISSQEASWKSTFSIFYLLSHAYASLYLEGDKHVFIQIPPSREL